MAKQGRSKLKGEITKAEKRRQTLIALAYRRLLGASILKSCTLNTPFGRMHYYDSAPKSKEEPTYLLHGLGSSGQSFSILAALLAPSRRVVIPDLFHFGGFSKSRYAFMTLQEHVDSVAFLMRALSRGPADFCGLSMGGWIGLWLARRYSELFRSLVLLNPTGVELRESNMRELLLCLDWEKFISLYPSILFAKPFNKTPLLSSFSRRTMYHVLKNDGVDAFVKSLKSEDFLENELKYITTRILLLWGRKDNFLSPQTPHVLIDSLPYAEGHFIEECAHILCLEAPLNVYTHLREFWGLQSKEPITYKIARKLFTYYPETPLLPKTSALCRDRVEAL